MFALFQPTLEFGVSGSTESRPWDKGGGGGGKAVIQTLK